MSSVRAVPARRPSFEGTDYRIRAPCGVASFFVEPTANASHLASVAQFVPATGQTYDLSRYRYLFQNASTAFIRRRFSVVT